MSEIKDKLNIGVVNMKSIAGDKAANITWMDGIVEEAASKGCEFLLFPELCITGYADGVLPDGQRMHPALAETIDGETSLHFSGLAQKHSMYILFGIPEKIKDDPDHAYNSVFIEQPDGKRLTYRKIHPVEADWCVGGSEPMILDTPWGPFGMSTCYDLYAIPELERTLTAKGVRLLINATASSRGFNKETNDSSGWQWYYTRRLDTISDRDGVFSANANLCGPDGFPDESGNYPFTFPGGSVVVSPKPGFEDKYVSYPVGDPGNKQIGLSCGEIDLSEATRAYFNQPVYRPELYSKWYKYLAKRSDSMRIAVSNFETKWGDKAANLAEMKKQAGEAADAGADLILFPEMALTGYWYQEPEEGKECMQHELAETIPGPATEELKKVAEEKKIYIVFGMPEKDILTGKYFNSAAILTPEGWTDSYRKIHPIGDESKWCEYGDTPKFIHTPWGLIGMSICYDTYFIPELARFYASQGARILLNPTASLKGVWDGKWAWYYKSRLEATCDRDGVIIASANILGQDGIPEDSPFGPIKFPGGSVVLGASWTEGKYYAGAAEDNTPGIKVSEPLDLSKLKWMIFHFKPELYTGLYEETIKKQ